MSGDPRKIERLMALTARLTEALEADLAALERHRPREMRTPQPDVQQMTALYRTEAAAFTPLAVRALPQEARDTLTAATARFKELLERHNRILTRVRWASEGMMRAIAEDVARQKNAQRPYAPPQGGKPRPTGALLYNSVI